MAKAQVMGIGLAATLLLATSNVFGQGIEDCDDNCVLVKNRESCESIGGQWALINEPPLFGRCELHHNYSVPAGFALIIDAGVLLVIRSWSTLDIQGRLDVVRTAKIAISPGYLMNTGETGVAFGGAIDVELGHIVNSTKIVNDGTVTILDQGSQIGFYNTGRIENEGVIHNRGEFVSYGAGRTIVAAGGLIVNSGVFYPNTLQVFGEFANESQGLVIQERKIATDRGGQFTNAGLVEVVGSQATFDNNATLFNDNVIRVTSQGEFRNRNHGQVLNYATIINHGAILRNHTPAVIQNQGDITNAAGVTSARFDNTGVIANAGTLFIGCLNVVESLGTITGNAPDIACPPWQPPSRPSIP